MYQSVWIEGALYLHVNDPFARHFAEGVGELHEWPDELDDMTLDVVERRNFGAIEGHIVVLILGVIHLERVGLYRLFELGACNDELHPPKIPNDRVERRCKGKFFL